MASFDTLIRGGRIVDGTGCPGYYADIGISGGRIAAIGQLRDAQATTVIDARGKTVAPGHVAQHAHYDVALFWDPYLSNSGENGVTTVVNANCGFGVAPARPADRERTMQMLETTEQIPVAHQRDALPWDWESFPEYLARVGGLDKGVNILSYLPLNPLLVYVMGVDAAKHHRPSEAEMAQIHRLINEAMDAGAIGISMSSMGAEGNTHLDCDGTPMPTDVLDQEVILDICRALVERGEGVIQLLSHLVIYGDRSLTERVLELAQGSGVTVVHNAFITSDLMPEMIDRDLAWLDGLRAHGYDVTANCFLHRGWIEAGMRQLDVACGMLTSVRKIAACKSDVEVLDLVADPDYRAAFAAEYAEKGSTNGANGLEGQIVIAVGHEPALQGYLDRCIGDIAEELGCGPVETLLELATRSRLALQLRSPPVASTDPRQAARMLGHTATVVGGSDGGAHTKSFGMGHVPTDLLIWLGREEKLMSQEELHFHLALKPARAVQVADRGALLPGFWADILIYDLDELYFDTFRYEIVHDMPHGDWRRKGRAGGYDYILVNGGITHRRDEPTGVTSGQLLRPAGRGRAALAAV
ncbi:amidohydrolase [Mangrovimicrobium sediminis]|uniref:Amidohydrolase n=1 Tax=Mangrovimicrobium sediminis TaxID=2562682 RepID=A0A4Z0LYT6_9GAMM|nr:amidohydrolase family protein [Haliea sp. SAOS-164]TGD72512.1 amidohydrolase [Haliea sp. SAOS-164]